MNTKIFVTLFAVLLTAGPASFAGDNEVPFNGWFEEVGEPIPIEPSDYPYLQEVIDQYGPPSSHPLTSPRLLKAEGNSTVGGKSTIEEAVIIYFFPLPDYSRFVLLYYIDATITVANGDEIWVRTSGIMYYPNALYVDQGTIVGGTGRFENAEGEYRATQFTPGIGVYEGYIKY